MIRRVYSLRPHALVWRAAESGEPRTLQRVTGPCDERVAMSLVSPADVGRARALAICGGRVITVCTTRAAVEPGAEAAKLFLEETLAMAVGTGERSCMRTQVTRCASMSHLHNALELCSAWTQRCPHKC
jgi:hypothetical protein